jgi:hypothetical protein
MKKLRLRSETLRALTLSPLALAHVNGGVQPAAGTGLLCTNHADCTSLATCPTHVTTC